MKVIALNGSPRKEGNTALLLGHVASALEQEGIETETVHIAGAPVRGCTACMKCRERQDGHCIIGDDIVNGCIDKMVASDGILLGSPTYFADLTAEMKALIDRAGFVARGNGHMLRRKVGAAVAPARRAGSIHALDSMNHFFLLSQMIVPGSSYWNMAVGRAVGDVESDAEGIDTMKTLGQTMAWLLTKLAN